MTFETCESGVGLVQELLEKEHGGRLWVRHKTGGKLFHRMVSQMRKAALQQGGVIGCGG